MLIGKQIERDFFRLEIRDFVVYVRIYHSSCVVVHNLSTISFDYKLITRSREKPQPRSKGLSCSHLLGLEEEG